LLGAQADPDRYYQDVVLPNKLSMNLKYLDRVSLPYDLLLLWRTTGSVFIPWWTPKPQ
jgi:hypothetical protein